MPNPTPKEIQNVIILTVVSILIILVVGWISFHLIRKHEQKVNNNKEFNINDFINGKDGPQLKNILVGMVFGTVFGFIDNAGMFFGMAALNPVLPKKGFIRAGIGNTYSSLIGAFLAAFLSKLVVIKFGVSEVPVWSDAAGIGVGAILGIYVPPLLINLFK